MALKAELSRDCNPQVAAVIAAYPTKVRTQLLRMRHLLLDTARSIDGVGAITETLKWGEPAYLTQATKSGSTIRFGWKPATPERLFVYLNCQTTLVEMFRTVCPELEYEGNRAIVLMAKRKLPEAQLRECFAAALTYHKRKLIRTRRG